MENKAKVKTTNPCGCPGAGGWKIDCVSPVDERGQMVLPKAVRDRLGIHPGDKLAILTGEWKGKVCCITLIKADELAVMARELLGPLMKEIFHFGGK